MERLIPFIISILLLINISVVSQDSVSIDTIQMDNFLVGIFDRQQLQRGEFGEYFLEEYANYQPCDEAIQELKKSIYNKSITILLATWCSDSQLQVGRFYKILDLLDYDTRKVTNYCLDKDKKAGDLDLSMYNVNWVPTFIFYEKNEEVGRIIESPNESLEKDMAEFFRN